MRPKLLAAIYWIGLVDILVVARQLRGLAIEYAHDEIIDLQGQPVETSLGLQVAEMPHDGGYVVGIDGLRPGFALAVLRATVKSVGELDVDAVDA